MTTELHKLTDSYSFDEATHVQKSNEFREKFEAIFSQQMVKHFGEDLPEFRSRLLYTKNSLADKVEMCYTDMATGTIVLMHTITIEVNESNAAFYNLLESEYPFN